MTSRLTIIPGAIFRHYKNKYYVIESIAKHTETEEDLIIYRSMYPSQSSNSKIKSFQVWARPKSIFIKNLEIEGKIVPRFEFIDYSF